MSILELQNLKNERRKLNRYLKMTFSFKEISFSISATLHYNLVLHIFYYYSLRNINHNNNKKKIIKMSYY